MQQMHPVVYQPLSVAPQHSHGEHTLALLDRFDFNSKLSFTIQIFYFSLKPFQQNSAKSLIFQNSVDPYQPLPTAQLLLPPSIFADFAEPRMPTGLESRQKLAQVRSCRLLILMVPPIVAESAERSLELSSVAAVARLSR